MPVRAATLVAVLFVLGLQVPSRPLVQGEPQAAVRPARVEPIQNLEVSVTTSFRPAFLPPEWGRLVAVERLDPLHVVLFLQAENGDLYLVRLSQRGTTFYVDTAPDGGEVTLIRRKP